MWYHPRGTLIGRILSTHLNPRRSLHSRPLQDHVYKFIKKSSYKLLDLSTTLILQLPIFIRCFNVFHSGVKTLYKYFYKVITKKTTFCFIKIMERNIEGLYGLKNLLIRIQWIKIFIRYYFVLFHLSHLITVILKWDCIL